MSEISNFVKKLTKNILFVNKNIKPQYFQSYIIKITIFLNFVLIQDIYHDLF